MNLKDIIIKNLKCETCWGNLSSQIFDKIINLMTTLKPCFAGIDFGR